MVPNLRGQEDTNARGADTLVESMENPANQANTAEAVVTPEPSSAAAPAAPTDAPPIAVTDTADDATPTDDAANNPVAEVNAVTDVDAGAAAPADGEADVGGGIAPEPATSEAVTSEITPAEPTASGEQAAADTPDAANLPFKRGDLLLATITETTPTSVRLDLDGKGEGIVPSHELDRMNKRTLESLKVGEQVNVLIVNPRDHQGNTIVSINRALEETDWQMAEQYRQSQEVYETKIAGYNKGGLIVRFGRLRGFVPQSQMSPERRRISDGDNAEERWSKMVNETIIIKVMEVDRTRNRLILSERSANRESREQRKANLINQLTIGEDRDGRVVSLEDFGAFIDVGGAEGLVHLTELSHQHVTHPRDLLKVGQQVRVKVISVDPEAKRIGLSLKQLEADPWDRVATSYNNGQLVRGTVTKLTKFGAFAQIDDMPEIEGLIHISELSDRRVTHPREVVNEGDILTLRVVKMDVKNRRLGLSLKKVNSPEYLDTDWGAGDDEE